MPDLDVSGLLQMGFSFYVAWFSLTKLNESIKTMTNIMTVVATKMGVGIDESK